MSDLFRPQVLAAQRDARFGDAIFHQPLALRIMVLASVLVLTGFIAFAATAEIKQTERVRGYLTSADGEVKVYAGRAGVLSRILVADGDYVEAGEIVAVVTDPQFDARGQQAATIALQQIDIQLQQLARRKSVLAARFRAQNDQLRQQLSGMQAALKLLREEQQILQQRVSLSEQDYLASQQLHNDGIISDREYRQVASALHLLRQQGKAGGIAMEKQMQGIREVEKQLVVQPLLAQEEQLARDNTESQLLAQRHELKTRGRFTITATRDGVVNNLVLRTGDLIDPREPLLTLLRTDDELEGWLYLPSRALADVRQGVDVMIAYDAYPYQTYGSFPAQVRSIANAAMDPREFLIPVDVSEPVYLVKISVSDQGLAAGDAVNRFRPGMQFSADIVTGQQTVLQKLVAPLSGLGRRL